MSAKQTTVDDIKLATEFPKSWTRNINGLQVLLLVAESVSNGWRGEVQFVQCFSASEW